MMVRRLKGKNIVFLALVLIGFLVRLYRINAPLADWHSWRQADTAAVARNFIKQGYDLLHPRFDDLSNIPSGKDNPQGYRFVEFPIYNLGHALFFQLTEKLKPGLISFEAAGRLVSIFASLIAAIFLYLIVREASTEWLALLSMAVFLLLPYNIYYSRTILPEPTMAMFALGGIYFLGRFQATNSKLLLFGSLLFSILAILVKPYAIFLLAPTWLIILGKNLLKSKDKIPYLLTSIFYILFSLLPFFAWRWWMRQFPEGIPANRWLFNLGAIRFRPAWWRWLFAERLAKLILGYWGLIPFGIGLIVKTDKKADRENREILFFGWLLGIFAYLAVFARGNVQHDYYQVITIPVIAVFVARGIWFLLFAPKEHFNRLFARLLLVFSCLVILGFSWYHIRDYYRINHPEIVEAGRTADKILPKEAKVIAPYNGDTAFLYQTNRQGWPAMTYDLERMVDLGATHYISVNFDQTTNELMKKCSVLEKTDRWVIIDLKRCRRVK